MPAIGKIYAAMQSPNIQSMEIGITYYIDVYDIEVTRKAIFIDKVSPVLTQEQHDESVNPGEEIPIRRIGNGLSEDDYEIDFTGITAENCPVYLEPESTYKMRMEERQLFVIFENLDLEIVDARKKGAMEDTLESLIVLQDKAIDDQDFHEAERLKKLIEQARRAKK